MRYCGYGKFINCNDCGRLVRVNKFDAQTNRCNNCYRKYRKQYKNDKEIERYYKNK